MLTIERLQCQHPQRNYRKPKRPWWLKQDGQEEEEKRVTPPWSSVPQSQGWWRMRSLLCQCSTSPTLHGFSHISEPRAWLLSAPHACRPLASQSVSVVRQIQAEHWDLSEPDVVGETKYGFTIHPARTNTEDKYFCSGRSSRWGLWPTPLCGKGKAGRGVKRKGERKDEKRK